MEFVEADIHYICWATSNGKFRPYPDRNLLLLPYCIYTFSVFCNSTCWERTEAGKTLSILYTESDPDLPTVTVQLPIYNELFVVDRLLDNTTKLQYPKDKIRKSVFWMIPIDETLIMYENA